MKNKYFIYEERTVTVSDEELATMIVAVVES